MEFLALAFSVQAFVAQLALALGPSWLVGLSVRLGGDRRLARLADRPCPHCAYDRVGRSGTDPCPECGLVFDDASRALPRPPPILAYWRVLIPIAVWCGALVVFALVLIVSDGGLFVCVVPCAIVGIIATSAWLAHRLQFPGIEHRPAGRAFWVGFAAAAIVITIWLVVLASSDAATEYLLLMVVALVLATGWGLIAAAITGLVVMHKLRRKTREMTSIGA